MNDEMNKNDSLSKETAVALLSQESYEIDMKMDPAIYPVIPLTEILKVDRLHFAGEVKMKASVFAGKTKDAFQHAGHSVADSFSKMNASLKKHTEKPMEVTDEAVVEETPASVQEEIAAEKKTDSGSVETTALIKEKQTAEPCADEPDSVMLEAADSFEEVHEDEAASDQKEDAEEAQNQMEENSEIVEKVEPAQDEPNSSEDEETVAVDRSCWLKVRAEEAGICRTEKRKATAETILDLFKESDHVDVKMNELASAAGVSATTVRSVLEELVKKNLLVRESSLSYALCSTVVSKQDESIMESQVEKPVIPEQETVDVKADVSEQPYEGVNKGTQRYSKAVLIREVNDGDLIPHYVEEYSGEPAKVKWSGRLLDPVGNMMEQAKSGVHTSSLRALTLTVLRYAVGAYFMLHSVSAMLNRAPFSFARMTFTDASSIWARFLFFGIMTKVIVDHLEISLAGGRKDYKRFMDIEAEGSVVLALIYSLAGLCLQYNWVVSIVLYVVGFGIYRILHTYSLELAVRASRNKTMWISLIGMLVGITLMILWFNFAGADIVRIVNSFVQF